MRISSAAALFSALIVGLSDAAALERRDTDPGPFRLMIQNDPWAYYAGNVFKKTNYHLTAGPLKGPNSIISNRDYYMDGNQRLYFTESILNHNELEFDSSDEPFEIDQRMYASLGASVASKNNGDASEGEDPSLQPLMFTADVRKSITFRKPATNKALRAMKKNDRIALDTNDMKWFDCVDDQDSKIYHLNSNQRYLESAGCFSVSLWLVHKGHG